MSEWLRLKEAGMKENSIRKLMKIYEDYEELFLEKNFNLFNYEVKKIIENSRRTDISSMLEICERNKVRIVAPQDREYPQNLKEVSDYPIFLYLKGNSLFNREYKEKTGFRGSGLFSGLKNENPGRKNIAVVGTRKTTKFGKSACEKIVSELLDYEVNLISGLAEGIDTVALTAYLEKGGNVTAVVGSGLDIVYPYENKHLWEKISEEGTIMSEYPLGTKPLKWNFPRRNRIIAGLSDGIIVVESFKSGGSLITAELGFQMDREIFSVPGFINYPSFEGCNNLIKENKAKLISGAEDIAKEFMWDINKDKSKLKKLTEEEKAVFDLINVETSLEEISKKISERRYEININKVITVLMSLKLKGLITETGNSKYIRNI